MQILSCRAYRPIIQRDEAAAMEPDKKPKYTRLQHHYQMRNEKDIYILMVIIRLLLCLRDSWCVGVGKETKCLLRV